MALRHQARYFKEEVAMRSIDQDECETVSGGFIRTAFTIGAVIAWAYANRASLVEIGGAAKARDAELDAEHS